MNSDLKLTEDNYYEVYPLQAKQLNENSKIIYFNEYKCSRCGDCCTQNTHIDITLRDIFNIAKHFKITGTDAFNNYCIFHIVKVKRNKDYFPCLKMKDDGSCIFYNNGCSIYSARPAVCRLYPFSEFQICTPLQLAARNSLYPNCVISKTCNGDEILIHDAKEFVSFAIDVEFTVKFFNKCRGRFIEQYAKIIINAVNSYIANKEYREEVFESLINSRLQMRESLQKEADSLLKSGKIRIEK